MLMEQTMEKLNAMKLFGMAKAFREWHEAPKKQALSPEDFVGILADAEWVHRESRKLQLRLTAARFKMSACVEDIDFAHPRGLSKSVLLELAVARADGSLPTLLKRLAKTNVLVLDDFGLEALTAQHRKDLLEVLDDRYDSGSTIITSQLEPKEWHAVIGDPTLADAICDRLVHNAHRIKLNDAESIRKTAANLTTKQKASK